MKSLSTSDNLGELKGQDPRGPCLVSGVHHVFFPLCVSILISVCGGPCDGNAGLTITRPQAAAPAGGGSAWSIPAHLLGRSVTGVALSLRFSKTSGAFSSVCLSWALPRTSLSRMLLRSCSCTLLFSPTPASFLDPSHLFLSSSLLCPWSASGSGDHDIPQSVAGRAEQLSLCALGFKMVGGLWIRLGSHRPLISSGRLLIASDTQLEIDEKAWILSLLAGHFTSRSALSSGQMGLLKPLTRGMETSSQSDLSYSWPAWTWKRLGPFPSESPSQLPHNAWLRELASALELLSPFSPRSNVQNQSVWRLLIWRGSETILCLVCKRIMV